MIKELECGERRVLYNGTEESIKDVKNLFGHCLGRCRINGRKKMVISYKKKNFLDEVHIFPGDTVCQDPHTGAFWIITDESIHLNLHCLKKGAHAIGDSINER